MVSAVPWSQATRPSLPYLLQNPFLALKPFPCPQILSLSQNPHLTQNPFLAPKTFPCLKPSSLPQSPFPCPKAPFPAPKPFPCPKTLSMPQNPFLAPKPFPCPRALSLPQEPFPASHLLRLALRVCISALWIPLHPTDTARKPSQGTTGPGSCWEPPMGIGRKPVQGHRYPVSKTKNPLLCSGMRNLVLRQR